MAAAAVALASAAGGGDSFLLFGGDYSFGSVAAECFRFALFFITGVLGGAAGGAGGSLFIPLLLSVFNFYIYALPLSRAAVFGMAVGAVPDDSEFGLQNTHFAISHTSHSPSTRVFSPPSLYHSKRAQGPVSAAGVPVCLCLGRDCAHGAHVAAGHLLWRSHQQDVSAVVHCRAHGRHAHV